MMLTDSTRYSGGSSIGTPETSRLTLARHASMSALFSKGSTRAPAQSTTLASWRSRADTPPGAHARADRPARALSRSSRTSSGAETEMIRQLASSNGRCEALDGRPSRTTRGRVCAKAITAAATLSGSGRPASASRSMANTRTGISLGNMPFCASRRSAPMLMCQYPSSASIRPIVLLPAPWGPTRQSRLILVTRYYRFWHGRSHAPA